MNSVSPIVTQEVHPYQNWLKEEGIRVIRGSSIDDVRKVELYPWPRTGGLGVYLELSSCEKTGAYMCEIPPGKSLEPEKHLFEEFIYIVSGRGTTSIWTEGSPKQTFDFQEGSLFAPPLNCWHQLSNTNPDQPARFFAVTGAPVFMNLFHNWDFTFNNDFVFKDRYAGEIDYFSGQGKLLGISGRLMWETNFIKDVRNFQVSEDEKIGKKAKIWMLELSQNTMEAHISEFAAGTYKKAHHTSHGAHILIIDGKGYTLMWRQGEPKQRFDWHEGTIVAPLPSPYFHQHFVTGRKPAKQLAIHWNNKKYRFGMKVGVDKDIKEGGVQIEYWDEDPDIRQLYEEELAKEGLRSEMDESLYRKP